MYLPHILLALYGIVFIVCGIDPYNRAIWVNENAPVIVMLVFLIVYFKKFRFSNTSYILIFIGMITQTIGGHYTFARVPFEWASNLFGFKRDMYDRVGHFALGLYAFPLAEYLYRKQLVKKSWLLYALPVMILFGVASIYEIIERLYPMISSGKDAAAFLGSQGDKWDAQADMLCNGTGAIIAMILFWIKKPSIKTSFVQKILGAFGE